MKSSTNNKLGVIGTVGVPARYGGFETLVHYLVPNLNQKFDMTIYCSGKTYSRGERLSEYKGAKLHYIPLEANGIQSIAYDLWSIIHAVFKMDVLLILGVSGCLFLPFIKLFTKKKVIVNIDGLEWRRPKWNKFAKKFLLLSEKIACKYADEIVTDNRILKEYVKIRYGIDGNLIEYGADHVKAVGIGSKDIEKYAFLKNEYAFKVARIEPENNLHTILEAFANDDRLPIAIVGNWNNSAYGKNLKEFYNKIDHIHLLDPIYDQRELNLLRSNAKIYVHGHSAGGTNPSLVEAMYLGLPIMSFDVIYNRVTTNNQCFYFETSNDLSKLLNKVDTLPLDDVSERMRNYALGKYTWSVISMKYKNLALGLKPDYSMSVEEQLEMKAKLSEGNTITKEVKLKKVKYNRATRKTRELADLRA